MRSEGKPNLCELVLLACEAVLGVLGHATGHREPLLQLRALALRLIPRQSITHIHKHAEEKRGC